MTIGPTSIHHLLSMDFRSGKVLCESKWSFSGMQTWKIHVYIYINIYSTIYLLKSSYAHHSFHHATNRDHWKYILEDCPLSSPCLTAMFSLPKDVLYRNWDIHYQYRLMSGFLNHQLPGILILWISESTSSQFKNRCQIKIGSFPHFRKNTVSSFHLDILFLCKTHVFHPKNPISFTIPIR